VAQSGKSMYVRVEGGKSRDLRRPFDTKEKPCQFLLVSRGLGETIGAGRNLGNLRIPAPG